MIKLDAKKLRQSEPSDEQVRKIKRKPIYFILEDVLDTYNVGGIFRLADAIGASGVYLCGQTETPPNPKIKKASIGTWKWTPWEHCKTAKEAILKTKDRRPKTKIVCVEQDRRSVPYNQAEYSFPLALVVGNESFGISKKVLKMADAIVEIPLFGVNKSLNVIVSLGIVTYHILENLKTI